MLLIYSMNTHTSYTVEQATKKMEGYCAYQERCHQEVQKKLESMGMIPLAIDTIVVHLLQHDFLNEERFAKAFVRGKFRIKKWGNYRITQELKQRGIIKNLITSALQQIPKEEYLQTFHELAEKKAASIHERNLQKKKRKLADYLLYRGWESYLVYEKVNEILDIRS